MINRRYSFKVGDITFDAEKWTVRQAVKKAKEIDKLLLSVNSSIKDFLIKRLDSIMSSATADEINASHGLKTNVNAATLVNVILDFIMFLSDLDDSNKLTTFLEILCEGVTYDSEKINVEEAPLDVITNVISTTVSNNNFLSSWISTREM